MLYDVEDTDILDGLFRWNEDWATGRERQSYSGLLRHTANTLGMEVLGENQESTVHRYFQTLIRSCFCTFCIAVTEL